MSGAETVEHRLGKVRAFIVALASIAERDGARKDDATTATHLEIVAKEELDKVTDALGVEVLNRDC
ncbi:MAG: hypothetical protein EPO10_11935 [Reyranella sp.]|uniref:hypothetical protein n=1 Tax=Reyranella sp. TaxID=1929291 RepID=UPI001201B31B|nr:hypothetical protein [Reyranella sp.]TAJ91245.1 MAG: hypothetical protein EPO41_15290 [Reyranella sp.]TBR28649.1 MAG: hypothetical protein EPO10_11935 [Reyranella sp.]